MGNLTWRSSDGDGIADGTELGVNDINGTANITRKGSVPGAEPTIKATADSFTGDQHPASHTDPRDEDSDDDGLCDGDRASNYSGQQCARGEDLDRNGKLDDPIGTNFANYETDPNDDDTDGDGLHDDVEKLDGRTDPRDYHGDIDNDGIPDFYEDTVKDGVYNPNEDHSNFALADTDRDGIPDGIENDTIHQNGLYIRNATGDLDSDGIIDSVEDANQDGIVDAGETDYANADSEVQTQALSRMFEHVYQA